MKNKYIWLVILALMVLNTVTTFHIVSLRTKNVALQEEVKTLSAWQLVILDELAKEVAVETIHPLAKR